MNPEQKFTIQKSKQGKVLSITTYTVLSPTVQDLINACAEHFPGTDLSKIYLGGMPMVTASIK